MRVMAMWCDFQSLDLREYPILIDIRQLLSKIDLGRASQFTSLKPVLSLEYFLLNRSRYCTYVEQNTSSVKRKAVPAAQGQWTDDGRVEIDEERHLRQQKRNLVVYHAGSVYLFLWWRTLPR